MDSGVRVIVAQNEGVIARIAFAPDRILPFDIIKVESQLADRYFIHRMRDHKSLLSGCNVDPDGKTIQTGNTSSHANQKRQRP